MMPSYLRYAIAASCGVGAFLLTAPVAPAAVLTMSASQWLLPSIVGAVAGMIGYSPLSNLLDKTFFSKKGNPGNGTPQPSQSSDESSDNSQELSNRFRDASQELSASPVASNSESSSLAQSSEQEAPELEEQPTPEFANSAEGQEPPARKTRSRRNRR